MFTTKAIEEEKQLHGFIHTKLLERKPEAVTRVGSILKKFYLDELAQLFNILKGDMSFVGTRPWNTVVYQNEIKTGIFRKKIITPGLTGLVQIFKGHTSRQLSSQALDDYYISFTRHNSGWKVVLFDIHILFLSARKILKGEGL